MSDNLRECHFGGVEVARPMLEFKRLLSRGIVNNPYFIHDDLSSEEGKIKMNKQNGVHIIINITTGGGGYWQPTFQIKIKISL